MKGRDAMRAEITSEKEKKVSFAIGKRPPSIASWQFSAFSQIVQKKLWTPLGSPPLETSQLQWFTRDAAAGSMHRRPQGHHHERSDNEEDDNNARRGARREDDCDQQD